MNTDCLMCGKPADPLRIRMCHACFDKWTEMTTAQWLKDSSRKLELYASRENSDENPL